MLAACVVLLFIFFTLPSLSLQASSPDGPKFNGGLVIELIPHDEDSPHDSPFHNPDVKRSITDYKFIRYGLKSSSLPQDLTEPLVYGEADPLYFMRLSIGSPPVEVMLLMDTGSDLVWTQCFPCVQCYKQSSPIFDPYKSSTFAIHECDAEACEELSRLDDPCTPDGLCLYSRFYGSDGLSSGVSMGSLSSETFTMTSSNGPPATFPDILFGCGHINRANFTRYAGIAGLGGDASSLTSQLGMQMESWRFSYCLSPSSSKKKSHLYIGANALLLGNSTPLAIEPSRHNYKHYYLKLEDISVGSQRLSIPPGTFDKTANNAGGVIIDTGTPYTFLKREAFDMLVQELRVALFVRDVVLSSDDLPRFLKDSFCLMGSWEELVEEYAPILTLHFSGLDVPLHPSVSFEQITEYIVCLTIAPAGTDGLTIIGNILQQNMNVGYDLDNEKLTMAPADCSNY